MSIRKRIQDRIDRQIICEVNGEDAFQIWGERFITGPLPAGGTLYYGPTSDKSTMKAWTEVEDTDGFFLVNNAVPGMWYYISGNTGNLKVYYV